MITMNRTVLLTVVAISGISLASTSAIATAQSVPSTPTAHTWMYQAAAGNDRPITQSQAISIALSTDRIVAYPRVFAADLPAMRAANPDLKVYAYVNGAYAANGTVAGLPAADFAHDAAGNVITSAAYGNDLMNTGAPGWQQTVVTECRTALAASGYDGCYLDSMGPAALFPGYDSALPVDPATGQVFTATAWLAQALGELNVVEQALAPTPVLFNGLGNGRQFFNPNGGTANLLPGAAGGMAEVWLRSPTLPPDQYPTAKTWLAAVQMLQQTEAEGQAVMVCVKLWVPATQAQTDAWHLFSLASYLLAANGQSFYQFIPGSPEAAIDPDSLASSLAIGTPTGPMASSGGVYTRSYTGGLVLVNPGTSTVTVPLAHAYTDTSGNVLTAVTLGADTAAILTG